jgi:predicted esterase
MLSVDDLMTHVYRLYEEEFVQAHELLEQHANRFPDAAWHLYYRRILHAFTLQRYELAVDLLEEALSAGQWYSERRLKAEIDLEKLQRDPRYDALAKLNQSRAIQAQAKSKPSLRIFQPDPYIEIGASPKSWMLVLHGNTRSAESAVDHWADIASSERLIVCPQASQLNGPGAYVWSDWDLGRQETIGHYKWLKGNFSLDERSAIFSGFSMGGGLATWLSFIKEPIPPIGFLVLAPYILDFEPFKTLLTRSESNELRGYIAVGEEDVMCLSMAKCLHQLMNSHGQGCKLEILPSVGHGYPSNFNLILSRGIEFLVDSVNG